MLLYFIILSMLICSSSTKFVDHDIELSKLIGQAYLCNMGSPHFASTYLALNQVTMWVLHDARKKEGMKLYVTPFFARQFSKDFEINAGQI